MSSIRTDTDLRARVREQVEAMLAGLDQLDAMSGSQAADARETETLIVRACAESHRLLKAWNVRGVA